MIERIDITRPHSFTYLRKELDRGRTLCNLINKLNIENGKVYAFIESGTSEKQLFNFEAGGIYPFEKELLRTTNLIPIRKDARPIVVRTIQKYLDLSPVHCCLFQNPVHIPADFGGASSDVEYLNLDDKEIFYFFDQKNNDFEKIEEAFKLSEDYIFTCALSTLNDVDKTKFTPYKNISLKSLELFVDNLSSFFVKAYDGEGYLMWVSE